MGVGLRQNLGKDSGPSIWSNLTKSTPNSVFQQQPKKQKGGMKKNATRQSQDDVKAKRRQSKYTRKDNSAAARKAYSRHDNDMEPDDLTDDVSPDILKEMKNRYFKANVAVSKEEAIEIEKTTKEQAGNDRWRNERKKRLTASKVGGILKMRTTTKRANKVKELLYSTFVGNNATRYGIEMEETARMEYAAHQQQNKCTGINATDCGLFVSLDNPWLALLQMA